MTWIKTFEQTKQEVDKCCKCVAYMTCNCKSSQSIDINHCEQATQSTLCPRPSMQCLTEINRRITARNPEQNLLAFAEGNNTQEVVLLFELLTPIGG